MTKARVAFVCLTFIVLALSGCGGGTARVSGVVRFQGKPVASGTVQAVGVDNRLHLADIAADGSYTITDLPAGSVRFLVLSPDPSKVDSRAPRKNPRAKKLPKEAEEEPEPPRPAPPDPALWFPLPERYSRYETSGLEAVLRPGENPHDLEME